MNTLLTILLQLPDAPTIPDSLDVTSLIQWILATLMFALSILAGVIVYLEKRKEALRKEQEAKEAELRKEQRDTTREFISKLEVVIASTATAQKDAATTTAEAMKTIRDRNSADEDRRIEQNKLSTGQLRETLTDLIRSQSDFNQRALLGLEAIVVNLNQLSLKVDKLDESKELRRDLDNLVRQQRNNK